MARLLVSALGNATAGDHMCNVHISVSDPTTGNPIKGLTHSDVKVCTVDLELKYLTSSPGFPSSSGPVFSEVKPGFYYAAFEFSPLAKAGTYGYELIVTVRKNLALEFDHGQIVFPMVVS